MSVVREKSRQRSTRPTKRHERRRIDLLRAAVAAFKRKGFHQTSLEDIGETVGVTKAALYYYYPSKSALLAACFDSANDIARECVMHARREQTSGRARIVAFFRRYIERTHEELHDCVLLTEDYALESEHRATLIRRRDAIERHLRGFVKDGIADGSIATCDPKLAVFIMLGAVNWLPKWFSPHGSWSYRQVAGATADMIERMLTTGAPPNLVSDVRKQPVGA